MSNRVGIKYMVAETGDADVTGVKIPVANDRSLSVAYTWTGTLAGSFILQCSHDDGTTWAEVTGASTEWTQPAGSAQSTPVICNWQNVPGNYWRVFWDVTSGSGTISMRASQGDRFEV